MAWRILVGFSFVSVAFGRILRFGDQNVGTGVLCLKPFIRRWKPLVPGEIFETGEI
jgi:hypothetical protein